MTSSPDDPHGLQRFVDAQEAMYEQALGELRVGRKRSHWIWYVLPQIHGLGMSSMSVRYAIGSLEEARSYLAHPLLGPRLRECVAAMVAHKNLGAVEILGGVDARKFHSCLTLFGRATEGEPLFETALGQFYRGEKDEGTLRVLAA
jgi:uncharacterized protein (DUF1810 family)